MKKIYAIKLWNLPGDDPHFLFCVLLDHKVFCFLIHQKGLRIFKFCVMPDHGLTAPGD